MSTVAQLWQRQHDRIGLGGEPKAAQDFAQAMFYGGFASAIDAIVAAANDSSTPLVDSLRAMRAELGAQVTIAGAKHARPT